MHAAQGRYAKRNEPVTTAPAPRGLRARGPWGIAFTDRDEAVRAGGWEAASGGRRRSHGSAHTRDAAERYTQNRPKR